MDETLANQDNVQVASARLVGTVLDNKYRVERILGAGGMGYVVAASHVDLGTKVAIKFMAPELVRDKGAVARFMREARASVRITGEHVARVLDVSRMQDGTPYMVMEHLDGRDLGEILDELGHLDPETAVDFILQACEAIAEAHRIGIIHRDLKPSNLFLTQRADGTPLIKVLDFGISKVRSEGVDQTKLTATQTLLGSPTYMSPEQVRRPDSVDARSDVWTLGVILFELLGDTLPFTGDSHMSVLAAVVSDPVPDVHELIPEIDVGLAAVIQRCLIRDPGRRTQDVGQLAIELTDFAAAHSLPSIERIAAVLARSETSVTPQGLSRKPEFSIGSARGRGATPGRDSASARTVPATPTPSERPTKSAAIALDSPLIKLRSDSSTPDTSVGGTPPDARTHSHAPGYSRTENAPPYGGTSRKVIAILIGAVVAGTAFFFLAKKPPPSALSRSGAPATTEPSSAASPEPEPTLDKSATPSPLPTANHEESGKKQHATPPQTKTPVQASIRAGQRAEVQTRATSATRANAPPSSKEPSQKEPAPPLTTESTEPKVDPLDGRF